MAKGKKEKEEKVLTDAHLNKIENFVQKQQLVQNGLKEIDYKMQLLRADTEIAKLQIKLKEALIRDFQRVVPDYKQKIKAIKEDEKEYLKEVKEELDIKAERWGFDPDSGLIKEDTEES